MADDNNSENLDELLDSALKDFDKNKAQNKEAKKENNEKTSSNDDQTEGGNAAVGADAFFEEHAKMLSERMKTLFSGAEAPSGDGMPSLSQDPERILAGFKEVAQAAALTLEGTNPANDEDVAKYTDIIAQALKGIQDGTDNINSNVDDNDVLSMLNNLNLDGSGEGGADDGNVFLPFMEGMMQTIFSAEILLPSTMEILAIYPKYLEENADKLSAEDKERYQKQYELYKVIAGLLKEENPNDSAVVKREKFRRVLDEMRKLQDLGAVPPEILSATTPDLTGLEPLMNNAGGNPGGPQCPMM